MPTATEHYTPRSPTTQHLPYRRFMSYSMLLINKCSDPALWYAKYVGQFVPHCGFQVGEGFKSREQLGYLNYVREEDARPTTALASSDKVGTWPFTQPTGHAIAADLPERHGPFDEVANQASRLSLNATPFWIKKQPANHAGIVQNNAGHQWPTEVGQTRTRSAIEAIANTVVGFVAAAILTAWLLPAFGHDVTLGENLQMTAAFTALSFLRGYVLRRFFNALDRPCKTTKTTA